jgi:glycerol-3-phosphate cytidylyltransferase
VSSLVDIQGVSAFSMVSVCMAVCVEMSIKAGRVVYMTKVITYGTFDLLHYGHINLLKRAKELGDYLIVALSTNEFNRIKGKECYFSYEERKKLVESIRYVDLVIPENSWEQKIDDIREFKVDIFVMGNDWEGKFDHLKEYCKVLYLARTPEISTTKIKGDLLRDGIVIAGR